MIVPIPEDIYAYESKSVGNLTKRQAISFGLGGAAVLGIFIPLMIYTQSSTIAAIAAFFIAMPVFLCGIIRKDGQPFEKVIRYRMEWKKRSGPRPYRAGNFYEDIQVLEQEENSNDFPKKGLQKHWDKKTKK